MNGCGNNKYTYINKTVDNSLNEVRNTSSMSYKYSDSNKLSLQSNKIVQELRPNRLKLKSKKKLIPKRKTSFKLFKRQNLESKDKLNLSLKLKKRNSSMLTTKGVTNKKNYLVNRTIEYHEKTMIEEFTNTNIPEFTLGPNHFDNKPQPKPLSVNRMGFYEDCKKIERVISPIKKNENIQKQKKLFNIKLEEGNNDSVEDEFYDN